MNMNKKEKGIATVAAILVGCGVAIGAMATKIYLDKTKEYREEVKRLKNETDFKLSKEFLRELKEELKADEEAKVVVVESAVEVSKEVEDKTVVASDEPQEDPSTIPDKSQEAPASPAEDEQEKSEVAVEVVEK